MVANLNDLNNIFSKAFDTATVVTMDSVRDDFEAWDSINYLNLVVELEDFYHVQFSMEEIKEMNSIKKIIEVLGRK